jgi:GH24 family phage-related lysozyme (muramidase)
MANPFDDLLTNLVDRLKNVGMGSRTAAENRAMIDYVTASNKQAQAGQATPREYAYYYGSNPPPATSLSNNINSYGNNQTAGMVGGYGGYSVGNKPQGMLSNAEVLAGAIPDPLDEYRLNQLQIEQNIRDREDAAAPKDRGFGESTLERRLYDAKIEEDRRRREELVKNNISIERRANEERRMLQQAETEQRRRSILDSGGMDMPYKGQGGVNTIEIEPVVLDLDELLSNNAPTEIVRTLEKEYADLAAAGADTATLSALAREIDSYRDRQSSLPSIVSEAAASDVIENAPVNYDAFGNVISQPETEVLMSRQAQIVDPVDDRFINYIERVEGYKTGKGKTPFRYESPEGGLDTVGLGHKLTQDEIDSNSVYGFDLDTLTKEQVKEIFREDLIKYEKMLKSDLKTNYKEYEMEQPIDYDTLNQKQKEMFLDFTFNLGSLKSFPKFTEAVLKGDMATARKEYKRYFENDKGEVKEVKDRNEQFFETYLK